MMKLPEKIRQFIACDQQRVWIRPDYLQIFRDHGLTNFAAIMNYSQGALYKKNRFRDVWRWQPQGSKALFCKRHFAPSRGNSIRSWMGLRHPHSAARQEIEAIGWLNQIGIQTIQPVAFGEIASKFWEGPSFLMTEELAAAIKIERYLREQSQQLQVDWHWRRRLITELAALAAHMHTNDIHHQDFYLGHILISWPLCEPLQIWLIDLQRMHKRHNLSRRWRIKDLAQINYSAPAPLISRIDRWRFWRAYSGDAVCPVRDRLWSRAILRRYHKMKRHDAKKQQRGRNEDQRLII